MGTAVEIHNSAVWSAASHAVEDSDASWILEGSIVDLEDNNATVLRQYAIAYMNSLRSVSLNALTAINQNNVIRNNAALQSISLPELLTIYGTSTLNNNTSLRSVNVPKLASITGDTTFSSNTSLTTFNAPLLESINGVNTFQNCNALTELDLPSLYITTTTNNADFTGAPTSLTTVTLGGVDIQVSLINNATIKTLRLPNAVRVVGTSSFTPFQGMSALETLYAPKLTRIEGGSTSGTTITRGTFRSCTSLASLDLPELLYVGNACFSGCSNLGVEVGGVLSPVNLPKLYDIRAHAFASCTNLKELNLPAVGVVSEYAFNKSGLMNLTLGSYLHPVISLNSSNALTGINSGATVTIFTEGGTPLDGTNKFGFTGTITWADSTIPPQA